MVSWGEREWRNTKEGSRHSRLKVTSGKYWKAMQWSVDSQTIDICDPMKLESRKAPFNDWSLVINRKWWNINNRSAVPFLIDEPWDWLLILLFLPPKHLWYDVCCVLRLCLSSHVSPARPWPKASNRTPPWRSWFWWITTSALKGLRLGVWWEWGHEGKWGEEIARNTAAWKWH